MVDRPTPYADLNDVLRELVASVQGALGDSFLGAYLQGSFAVGDFDQHSDVDFIVAIRDELSERQVAVLQALHARVCDLDSEWAKHLEGSYFPASVLRRGVQPVALLWYGADWAKATLDPSWSPLIDRAWRTSGPGGLGTRGT